MKILVIGDIIIDKYIYGTSTRLSPEAPVPVVSQKRTEESLGGAGLVYENLKSLGVDVELFNYQGNNSVKTRVMCDGHYVTRIDNDVYADGVEILERIQRMNFSAYSYVILSDYNKGVLDQSLKIIEHLNTFGCKVIVDPKEHATQYEGAWLVKPNHKEFSDFGFIHWQSNIITTNAGNNVIAKIDDNVFEVPVDNLEVTDVTGAGDCFMAGFVYGLTKEYNFQKCLEIAIKGSTKSVKHSGTYILTQQDIEETVVFTNGVFDILHEGHFQLLKFAKSKGNKLVVGINSDASTKRLKGESRPINDQLQRQINLKLLPWVDDVIIFNEDTPLELMKRVNPDLLIKGGDYTIETVVGHDLYPVELFPTVEGNSTSMIIEKIKQ